MQQKVLKGELEEVAEERREEQEELVLGVLPVPAALLEPLVSATILLRFP